MENHLKRVLELVRKTGDTMIVVDKDGAESFVVMDLDRYENLLDKPPIVTSPVIPQPPKTEIWDVMQEAGDDGETWDVDQLSNEELIELEKQYKAFADRNVEETVQETQKVATQEVTKPQESLENRNEDEYGEEQFYLEPVE